MNLSSFLLAIFAVYTASAVPVDVPEQPYSRFIEFTDENGILKTIDLEEEPDMQVLNRALKNADEENIYVLFTRENPTQGQVLRINDAVSIRQSNFNTDRSTVVLSHGWLGDEETGMNSELLDAFLGNSDVNVIILDWSYLAASINYVGAARGVPAVGQGLGRFLRFLNSVTDVSYDTIHLVGFSLGAHLVGNAGRELEGKIKRITALDPAGPLWNFNSDRLNADDAQYVEAIHTDGGLSASAGIGRAIGDADFFPNGGNNQPGCLTSICHHNRAWRFMAATVRYNHMVARWCSGMTQVTLNTCRGDELHMGNSDLNKTGSGIFRVNTGRRYPF